MFDAFLEGTAGGYPADIKMAWFAGGNIMNQRGKLFIGKHFPTKSNHKGTTPKGIDIARGITERPYKVDIFGVLFLAHNILVWVLELQTA